MTATQILHDEIKKYNKEDFLLFLDDIGFHNNIIQKSCLVTKEYKQEKYIEMLFLWNNIHNLW